MIQVAFLLLTNLSSHFHTKNFSIKVKSDSKCRHKNKFYHGHETDTNFAFNNFYSEILIYSTPLFRVYPIISLRICENDFLYFLFVRNFIYFQGLWSSSNVLVGFWPESWYHNAPQTDFLKRQMSCQFFYCPTFLGCGLSKSDILTALAHYGILQH